MTENTNPINELLAIMARLRDPQNGCPWDLKQDFDSITKHTLEETYELLEAIDKKDWPHVREELGDVLLQIVFYAQMAHEKNLFDFKDVVRALNDKLLRRHPHVFGDAAAETPEDVLTLWNKVKSEEKTAQTDKGPLHRDFGPKTLPALMRAATITKKAEQDNLKWENPAQVMAKIREELTEIETADETTREEEIGDALFALASLATMYKIDPERALQKAMQKYLNRWQKVYELAKTDQQELKNLDAQSIDMYWQKAKKSI